MVVANVWGAKMRFFSAIIALLLFVSVAFAGLWRCVVVSAYLPYSSIPNKVLTGYIVDKLKAKGFTIRESIEGKKEPYRVEVFCSEVAAECTQGQGCDITFECLCVVRKKGWGFYRSAVVSGCSINEVAEEVANYLDALFE